MCDFIFWPYMSITFSAKTDVYLPRISYTLLLPRKAKNLNTNLWRCGCCFIIKVISSRGYRSMFQPFFSQWDHSCSTYTKFSEKLKFLTSWYGEFSVRTKWMISTLLPYLITYNTAISLCQNSKNFVKFLALSMTCIPNIMSLWWKIKITIFLPAFTNLPYNVVEYAVQLFKSSCYSVHVIYSSIWLKSCRVCSSNRYLPKYITGETMLLVIIVPRENGLYEEIFNANVKPISSCILERM